VAESRRGLWLNAVAKIPMQLFILFIGVLVYVFYVYQRPPLLFQPSELAAIAGEARYDSIARRHESAFDARQQAANAWLSARRSGDAALENASGEAFYAAQSDLSAARRDATLLAADVGGAGGSDTNFVFLTFVTQYLPPGVVGLVIAVIFGATMAAVAAEMSALATVSVVDIYKRHRPNGGSDRHHLLVSRIAMVFWGTYAVVCAQYVKGLGSLVEVVNVLGSLFYGGMLGVFVLAFFFERVHARAAFVAVLIGEAVIFACWYFTDLAFLWYNVVGCIAVVTSGVVLARLVPAPPAPAATAT
jgi:Na+(H+)/acetate symporter ActP